MYITAIIPRYYQERLDNIQRIVYDLKNGSVVPNDIIVVNNDREFNMYGECHFINCNYNYDARVRYAVSLFIKTDLVLTIDDDLTIGKDTVKSLLDTHRRHPNAILGMMGRDINTKADKPYSDGQVFEYPEEDTKVDIVIGRIQLYKPKLVLPFYELLLTHPELYDDSGRLEDDIVFSMANKEKWLAESNDGDWQWYRMNNEYWSSSPEHWKYIKKVGT